MPIKKKDLAVRMVVYLPLPEARKVKHLAYRQNRAITHVLRDFVNRGLMEPAGSTEDKTDVI